MEVTGLVPISMNIRPEHFKGAASELLAATFYLNIGVPVYFPCVQQGSVDFVIHKKDGLKTVQVKTASWVKAGNNSYLQARTRLTNKYQNISPSELYDYLFIVSDIGYWEIPSNLIQSSNLCLANTGKNNCQWNDYIVMRELNYDKSSNNRLW